MKTKFIRTVMSGIIAASTLSFAPSASADTIQFKFGNNGPQLRVIDECDPRYERCGPPPARGKFARKGPPACTEDRALDKASKIGLRRAYVRSADRNIILVRGIRGRHDRVDVEFGRAPSCPILD